MGKTKNRRHRAKKPRPTGLPSVQEVEVEEAEFATGDVSRAQNHLFTLLERLQSSSEDDRICACASLANLVDEPAARQTLLRNGVVRCLGPLLLDRSADIREGATGALRNLSACGEDEVCDWMVNEDVMTPLVTLLQQFSDGIPVAQCSKDKTDTNISTLLQALHLLWNLCVSNATAVTVFNQQGLVHITLQCLKTYATFIDLALAAAHCLQTVSEDNPGTAIELTKNDALPILESALMSQGQSMQLLLLRALTSCTLYNIKAHLPAVSQNQTIEAITKVLCQALEKDTQAAITPLLTEEIAADGQILNGPGSQDTEREQPEFQMNCANFAEVEAVLTAQQVALEVISNMCCTEEEDDDWEDMASSSSSSSDDLPEVTGDLEEEVPLMSPLCMSDEIHEALVRHRLPEKVLAKCAFPDKTVLQNLILLSAGKATFKGLLRVQSRALLCLHNMVAIMDLTSLGGPEALTVVLDKLLALAMVEPAPAGDELLEALTSALRSVLQKMAACKHLPQSMTEQHLNRFYGLGQGIQKEQIRVNVVGMLGSIGSMIAANPELEPLLMVVGTQLSDVATKDQSLWVTAEALDAIFDTFGEGPTADAVALKIGLLSKLKTIMPQLKSRLREVRNQLGDHLPVVLNTSYNLIPFIKYKMNQATALTALPS